MGVIADSIAIMPNKKSIFKQWVEFIYKQWINGKQKLRRVLQFIVLVLVDL